MQIEFRKTEREVRLKEDKGLFGVAAVFYNADDPGTEYRLWRDTYERISPGAFDRALAEQDDVRALFNHEASQLIGRTKAGTLRLRKSDVGLEYHIPPNDTFWYEETATQVRVGNVDGSSFAFWPDVEEWEETDDVTIRTIRSVQLVDVGPVTWPAFESTTASVRGETWTAEARSRYNAWKAGQDGSGTPKLDEEIARQEADRREALVTGALTRARRFGFNMGSQ